AVTAWILRARTGVTDEPLDWCLLHHFLGSSPRRSRRGPRLGFTGANTRQPEADGGMSSIARMITSLNSSRERFIGNLGLREGCGAGPYRVGSVDRVEKVSPTLGLAPAASRKWT